MSENDQRKDSSLSIIDSLQPIIRIISSVIGIFIIIIGLMYACNIFNLLFKAVQQPELIKESLRQWEMILGENVLDVEWTGANINFPRLLAIMIWGFALIILTRIALYIIVTGAKVVSWASGDREALKKIYDYTLKEKLRREKVKDDKKAKKY